MDDSGNLINNVISYFSETKITEQFKNVFLQELKNDKEFQEKVREILESDGAEPGDEMLWKKMIEADFNLVCQETREKFFEKFEELSYLIFKSTESTDV